MATNDLLEERGGNWLLTYDSSESVHLLQIQAYAASCVSGYCTAPIKIHRSHEVAIFPSREQTSDVCTAFWHRNCAILWNQAVLYTSELILHSLCTQRPFLHEQLVVAAQWEMWEGISGAGHWIGNWGHSDREQGQVTGIENDSWSHRGQC